MRAGLVDEKRTKASSGMPDGLASLPRFPPKRNRRGRPTHHRLHFKRRIRISSRPLAATLGLLLTLASASSAFAVGTPEQRRACTPDVYRLCAGEIPDVRAITACLRRQKASLSEACRAVFEQ